MNILRWNRKSKNKIKPKTIILLIFSLIMTTFAWFAYSKILEPALNIHMASWDITYKIGETTKKNPIEIEFDVLYPTMTTQKVVIDIFNKGETLVDIEHQVKNVTIAGTSYEIVQEGSTPTSNNYIALASPVLTEVTNEDEDGTLVTEEVFKGVITNDITRFPFTIEIEHSSQVQPVVVDQYGTKTPSQGYLKATVDWIGDNNELDSEWGYIVGNYIENNPDEPAMSIELIMNAYQADPNAEPYEQIMPSTSTTRPYLPQGFSRVPGTNLTTGLVISDENGNEYVWVEVPKSTSIYRTAGVDITEFLSDDANGAFSKIETDLRNYVSRYTTVADTFSDEGAIGLNLANFTALKQKMLKSIYSHGGFYIGRYEAGIASESPRTSFSAAIMEPAVIKANVYPYNYVTCSKAHTVSANLAPIGYTSSLMFGLQRDLVMKYLETKSTQYTPDEEKPEALEVMQQKLKTDSTSWGNYENNYYSLANVNVKYMKEADLASGWQDEVPCEIEDDEQVLITSGGNSSFCKQNIYDLAGNLSEWTYNVVSTDDGFVGGNGGNYTLFGGNTEGDTEWNLGVEAGTDNVATANSCGTYDTSTIAKEVGFRIALISDSTATEAWGVKDTPITSITLDKENIEIDIGETATINAIVNDWAVGDINWESSDANIATVTESADNSFVATITGIAPGGPITITAKNEDGTISATCTVTVIAPGDHTYRETLNG